MKTHPLILRSLAALTALLVTACNPSGKEEKGEMQDNEVPAESIKKGIQVYLNHCAGCHGHQLEGSVAPALIHTEFKHGDDRNSIVKVIREGIPFTEMAGWERVLSEEDIDALTEYILIAQEFPEIVKSAGQPLERETEHYQLKIEKLVTSGIEKPWGMAFVNANRALITGNKGELRWMVDGKLDPSPIKGIPKTYAYDMYGGLMDITLDPDYSKNGWVYLAFSHTSTNTTDKDAPGMTKIVRGKVNGYNWEDEQVLFQVNDSLQLSGGVRWGSRLLFDKEGYLYFSIGDMARADDAQILSRPSGKIYRIHSDGSIPKDNPLYGREGDLQSIYSWGNRNVQGMAEHPLTGEIYASEHGPQGGDELNIIKNGANYGWPVITYGIDYDGSIISNDTHKEGMEQPLTYWTPSIAVSAIEFVESGLFPKWKNNLLVGSLKAEEIRRLVIRDGRVTEEEILLKGYGRIRDIQIAPGGALYILTNTPDEVLRINPK